MHKMGPTEGWCTLFHTVINGNRFRLCVEGEKELERLRHEQVHTP